MPNFALVLSATLLRTSQVEAVLRVLPDTRTDVLSPSRAQEWHLSLSDNEANDVLTAVRGDLGAAEVDCNLVINDAGRRKRLLIADMDSTIIEQECIDEIADFAGHGPEVAAITNRAMRGELDFETALKTRVALLAGLETATLERVFNERLTIMPGARELVRTMKSHDAFCALVSGGFTFFTERIAKTVGFDENRANTLEFEGSALTGRPVLPILGRQAKLDALRQFAAGSDIKLEESMAVGDGANDLAMIQAAGLGVAYRAKPVVAEQATARLDHSDLTGLLYLQGYRDDEIIW